MFYYSISNRTRNLIYYLIDKEIKNIEAEDLIQELEGLKIALGDDYILFERGGN